MGVAMDECIVSFCRTMQFSAYFFYAILLHLRFIIFIILQNYKNIFRLS